MRLFCFPHAGGGTAAYYRWQAVVPPEIEILPLRLPGRENRLTDPPYADVVELARDVANAISEAGNQPFALLGHSLGAYVAWESACQLRKSSGASPRLVIVSAAQAPHLVQKGTPISRLADREFVDEMVRRYDGIPPAFRDDPQLLAALLPPLRADVRMWEQYIPSACPPLDCEMMALGGADDARVPMSGLQGWRDYTTNRFSARVFPGGHFYLFRNVQTGSAEPTTGLQAVVGRLQKLLEEP
jgi:surfactin synthase thioesterase subunit